MLRKAIFRLKSEIINNKPALFLIAGFIILKLILIISFNNTDWEPDSYMHFLELRTVYSSFPEFLDIGLGVWAKPLFTYLLAAPVFILNTYSFFIVEIINLLIFSLIIYLVYKIVFKFTQDKKIALFSIFLSSLSLTLLKSSTSALTEPIFTLTLMAGFFAATKSKYYLASFLISLSVLGRIEGLFFIGIYFIWLCFTLKNWSILKHIIILALPAILWNFLGYLHTGHILYIFDAGYPKIAGTYGYGKIYSLFWQFLTKEPVISILYSLGIIYLVKNFRTIKYRSEMVLILSWSLLFLLIQSLLWWQGLFGSAGLMRYFVSTIPFMIIIGAVGLKLFNEKIRYYLIPAFIFTQIAVTAVYLFGLIPSKKEFPKRDGALIEAANWVKENVRAEEYLGSDRPEVIYYAQRDLSNSTIFYSEDLENNREGFYVWTRDWGVSIENISNKATRVYSVGDDLIVFKISL